MTVPTIFATCPPRQNVVSGATRDEQFMADLSQVVDDTALPDYLDPVLFFRKTFPTRGLRELMKAVCVRLSGRGGEVSPISRLGTQYGGGKTHGLIAITHAARGMAGVPNLSDFVEGEASDFEALEKLRRLAFAENVPEPKRAEQLEIELTADDSGEKD